MKDPEIAELFHKLWSKAVGQNEYNKKEWMKLQALLLAKGIAT